MTWDRNDLLSIDQLDRGDINRILAHARLFHDHKGYSSDRCRGKILYCAFFEPSTRTHESFGVAMTRLGGYVRDFKPEGSSKEKGERNEDTMRILAGYGDIIVVRDPTIGSVKEYADMLDVPLINAGDGSGEHPTQALLDCYTINEACRTLNGLRVVFMGDLKRGRTVHSLIRALRKYERNDFLLYSPSGLELPEELVDKKDCIKLERMDDIFQYTPDVIYATRLQKERMPSEQRDSFVYCIDGEFMQRLPHNAVVMHPLPRVDELSAEATADERFIAFKQAENGVPTRMAILDMMLNR